MKTPRSTMETYSPIGCDGILHKPREDAIIAYIPVGFPCDFLQDCRLWWQTTQAWEGLGRLPSRPIGILLLIGMHETQDWTWRLYFFYFLINNYVSSYVFELGTIWEFVQGIIFHFTILCTSMECQRFCSQFYEMMRPLHLILYCIYHLECEIESLYREDHTI